MDQYKKRIHLKNTEIGSLKRRLKKAEEERDLAIDSWDKSIDFWHERVRLLEQENQKLEFEIKALKASEAFADYYRNYYKDQYEALLDQVVPGVKTPDGLREETQSLLDHAVKVHMEYVEAMKGPTSLIVKDLPDDALADMLEQMKHTGLIFAPDNSTVDFLGLDIDKGVMPKDDALDALRYIPKEYWENPNKSGVTPRGEAMGMMDAISCSMQEASDHIKKPEIVGISSDDKKPPYFDLDD